MSVLAKKKEKKKFNHVMAKILNFRTTKQQTENLFKVFIENSTKFIWWLYISPTFNALLNTKIQPDLWTESCASIWKTAKEIKS